MKWILSIIGFFGLLSIANYLDEKWKKFLNKFSKKEEIENNAIEQVIEKPEKQKETLKPKQTKTENKPTVNIFKNHKIVQKQIYNEEKVSYKSLHKNIIPYLNFKGVYKFYHFTDVKNLKSIIKHGGLYSY